MGDKAAGGEEGCCGGGVGDWDGVGGAVGCAEGGGYGGVEGVVGG